MLRLPVHPLLFDLPESLFPIDALHQADLAVRASAIPARMKRLSIGQADRDDVEAARQAAQVFELSAINRGTGCDCGARVQGGELVEDQQVGLAVCWEAPMKLALANRFCLKSASART